MSARAYLPVARRLGWGVADQAFSSLTNFALGVLIARSVGTADFGAFAVAFATYTVAMGASRAVASEPLVVRFSAAADADMRAAARASAGTALAIGALAGAGCLAVAWAAGGAVRASFAALGIAMPGLLLQDAWRFILFAWGRGAQAFLNDVVWAVAMFAALAAAFATGSDTIGWLVLCWAGGACVAAGVGCVQARTVPDPARAGSWLRDQRDLSAPYLGEFVAITGARQAPVYAVGALGGLAQAGALRGANMILGPLHVFFMGIRLVAVPEGVRALGRSVPRFRRAIVALSAGLSAVALAWGAVAWALPDRWGRALLGGTWDAAHPVVVPMALFFAGGGWSIGPLVGLRALAAARRSFRARLAVSVIQTAGGLGGAALDGARGAAWGLAIAVWAGAVVWWYHYRRALAERDEHARPPTAPDAGDPEEWVG